MGYHAGKPIESVVYCLNIDRKPHRYVPPKRIWFLRFFGLKTSIHFAPFGLELGVVFEEKYAV